MKYNTIHIGQAIKQQLVEQNISIASFAKLINCSRSNVYNILEAQTLDVDRIIKISEALDYNFLQDYFSNNPKTNKIVFTVEISNGKVSVTKLNSKLAQKN